MAGLIIYDEASSISQENWTLISNHMKNNEFKVKYADAYSCRIFIAGDINIIAQECREFCMDIGLCVTVTPTSYIYTGGEETGAIIELINYARFPKEKHEISGQAIALGYRLAKKACQGSFTIMNDEKSAFYSRRKEDQ